MTDTIAGQLRTHARQRPGKIALIDRDRSFSYRTLDRMVDHAAHALIRHGIGFGDLVGVALGDHAEHIVMLLALGRIGATILPLDRRSPQVEIAGLADRFGARIVLHDGTMPHEGWLPVTADWFGETEEPWEDHRVTLDAPMVLSLSSGTTGTPKGPRTSHGKFIARFTLYWIDLGLSARDIFVTATPLYFGGGRAFALAMIYAGGTSALFCPPYKPAELIAFINRLGATATFLVPTLLLRLAAVAGEPPLLPTMRTLISSGAAIHPHEIARVRERLSANVFQYYSSTEGGGCSVLAPEDFLARPGSIGRPCFGVEVEVVDGDHHPVATGETGHLRYRSAASARAYAQQGDDRGAFHDGWFYPGDLGCIDGEGFLFLRGRAKDMIIRGGVNIYPTDIEAVLTSLPGVGEAAVIGIPSAEFGEDVCAFVVAPGVHEERLREACSARLAPYKIPARFVFAEALPRSAIGKIDKAALAAMLADTRGS